MKKELNKKLLDKYYNGDTSLEEEALLKEQFLDDERLSPEKVAFEYFQQKAFVPDGLEDKIYFTLKEKDKRKRAVIRNLVSISSVAASVLIVLGIYFNSRNRKYKELENSFFVMEQAMVQVSEIIQPQEQQEMLVLWVDDNVEIIIN